MGEKDKGTRVARIDKKMREIVWSSVEEGD